MAVGDATVHPLFYCKKISMKNRNNLIQIIFSFILISNFATAQTAYDALRFSSTEAGGTARTMSIGGAIGALGGDFATVSSNPAGLATFRKSEFTITPGYLKVNTKSKLTSSYTTNNEILDKGSSFGLSNIGLVISKKPSNKKWSNVNFAVGTNCIANYKTVQFYDGKSRGSITYKFVEQANANITDPYFVDLAFDANALILDTVQNLYVNDFDKIKNDLLKKNQTISTKGSINDLSFSLAGNYKEKWLLGVSVGVPILSFTENKTYKETNDGLATPFNSLTFDEYLNTNGVGINLKLGVIYKLNKMFRFGAALHTPTAYSLQDNYSKKLTYSYLGSTGQNISSTASSPDGNYEYHLNTPWKAQGSIGAVFGKSGFISAEVEYLDYSSSNFTFANTDSEKQYERDVNNDITNSYKGAINIKVGAEYAVDIFRIRGGYALYGSPFANSTSGARTIISGGIGLRGDVMFLDLGYQYSLNSDGYIPYTTGSSVQQFVERKFTKSNIVATIGFKF